ncbi:MAG: hypothetical protein JJ868_17935 [Shimia sp.]|uniref:hypothetical protein n=1 Tax=Shimia sp. TaxID=1954381 RepID=UPI001B2E9353|nr:hypothetical protein [Shimia sp.]MBO6899253.1 hypothetical protein [Shimia sp.]
MQLLFVTLGFFLTGWTPVWAQGNVLQERNAEAFASENAILDTGIPFAIGAREARQALRGSLGWPSFQEGLVEGAYFRFDPDGYARFAPTPRLDVDVFEVICRTRTHACTARKDGFEVFLTDRGQLQIRLEEAQAGDTFFVSEGVSEIQVPERILQPLDVQLELLLGAGGDLITRRRNSEVARTSLKGFSAVTAYLRWIAARQDYAVLPRGWPVPNAAAETSVTQPASWNSPMPQPQPQLLAPSYASGFGIAPATSAAPLTVASQPSAEALHDALADLKALIVAAQNSGGPVPSARDTAVSHQDQMSSHGAPDHTALQPADTVQLLALLEELQVQVATLQNTRSDVAAAPWEAGTNDELQIPLGMPAASQQGPTDMADEAERLAYLVKHLGYDAQTALAILKAAPDAQSGNDLAGGINPRGNAGMTPQSILYENALVDQILAEMEAVVGQEETVTSTEASAANIKEYELLSRYCVSAGLPALLKMGADNE